jgi:hypothetical protein
MRKYNRSALLAGASALALGAGISQAQAFDVVNWDWNAFLLECVNIHVDTNVSVDPTGIAQVEKLQISIGGKNANAYVGTVINDPAVTYTALTDTTTTDGYLHGGFKFDGKIYDEKIGSIKADVGWNGIKLDPQYVRDTDYMQGHGTFGGTFHSVSTSTYYVPDPINALTELPLIQVSAVALGNSEAITSDVAVALHEGQFQFDVGQSTDPKWDPWGGYKGGNSSDWTDASNTNTGLAATLLSDALDGTIAPSNLTANAAIGSAFNYQVDLSAVSISNNHSIELNASTPDDAMLIADLTQFSYANNTANAVLGVQTVSNYTNLGKLENALTNVSAIAAGNVSNITVTVPSP